MLKAPESIWASGFMTFGRWSAVHEGEDNIKYLRSTPERELASDLVEALRELACYVESIEEWMESMGYDGTCDIARHVLSKLDRGD